MIAYLILVHRFPEQFKRLFRSVYDPANLYLVHVDKNSGQEIEAEIRSFLAPYRNSAILDGQHAVWGGYSLVDAELRGMAALLDMGADWEFFINLSGQDFPLKSQKRIMDHLALNAGKEFIKIQDQQKVRPETMPRLHEYVLETGSSILPTQIRRSFMPGVTPYIGNQWMIVSRAFCEFVCHHPDAAPYKAFYRNTFIADEGFFQTVMMNNAVHGQIVSDDLRTIDWIPDGDIKLRPRTYTLKDADRLIDSRGLFARKFDMAVDADILDALENHMRRSDSTRGLRHPPLPEGVAPGPRLQAISGAGPMLAA